MYVDCTTRGREEADKTMRCWSFAFAGWTVQDVEGGGGFFRKIWIQVLLSVGINTLIVSNLK